MKEAIDSRKKNFSMTRNSWRIFSVDRLSQMTPILDNSLLSKKRKLSGMIKWGRMNVYILLENIVNQMLFSFSYWSFLYAHCLWNKSFLSDNIILQLQRKYLLVLLMKFDWSFFKRHFFSVFFIINFKLKTLYKESKLNFTWISDLLMERKDLTGKRV